MNKKEFTDAIDTILPMDGVKEEIWDTIQISKKKSPTKKTWLSLAASLVLICLVIYSVPVIAAEIQSRLLSKMPSYEPLAKQIETNIFSKTDDHLQVTVEELLSDGMAVYMTVKYTALDDIGMQWLNDYELKPIAGNYDISLRPDMGDMTVNKTNYSYGTFEITEQATETERFFFVKMESSSRDYLSGNGIFTFPLTNGLQNTILDISGNVEVLSYKLSDKESPSKFYTPSYIEISPMSFVIYAHNQSVFERETDGDYVSEKWLLPLEEIDSLEKNSYFILSDGHKEILPPGGHTITYPKPENLNSDVILYYGLFLECKENNQISVKTINPDEIEAVIINGVSYEFE